MKRLSPCLVALFSGMVLPALSAQPDKEVDNASGEARITQRRTIELGDGTVRSVAFSPDGKWVAGSGDRLVQWFDVNTGERLRACKGHTDEVNTVAFSPDGKLLASAGQDETIRLWEVETGKPRAVLRKGIANDRVAATCLAFSPDSKTLASCSSAKQQAVWLWDVENARWEHMEIGRAHV